MSTGFDGQLTHLAAEVIITERGATLEELLLALSFPREKYSPHQEDVLWLTKVDEAGERASE
jgi:hypothetical protein